METLSREVVMKIDWPRSCYLDLDNLTNHLSYISEKKICSNYNAQIRVTY